MDMLAAFPGLAEVYELMTASIMTYYSEKRS
jgi:hypothetical protein